MTPRLGRRARRGLSRSTTPHGSPTVFQNSPPTRFGSVYRDDLARPESLQALLHANLVGIETSGDAGAVTGLRVAALGRPQFRVEAAQVILATGGIENARLLLNADAVERGGLGNGNDLVGRFFMDHPYLWKTANIVFAEDYPTLAFYDYRIRDGIKVDGFIGLTAEAQRREGLPNLMFSLDRGQLADESTGVAALRSMYRSARNGHWPDHLGHQLGRVIGDLDGLAGTLYRRATHREPILYSVSFACECPPDPASRVSLIAERDALGQRRVQLDWRLPGEFREILMRALQILGEEIGRAGIGRLRLNATEEVDDVMASLENGHHHMGTTRMHDDPKQGVVDRNCRVHGKSNLYIAGSSIFPTYSYDDPTMTIVALALRLADHLKAHPV
jgi:choline dehydrogenase-like flavoprotein